MSLLSAVAWLAVSVTLAGAASARTVAVPILVYHRFGPVVTDSMTVRTSTLRWQLDYLKQHGYQPMALSALVSSFQHRGPPLPERPVVITADDGHVSVFREMLPLAREYNTPVTAFVYPSAISNASYAMTWEELKALLQTRLFTVHSHTFWHPRFDLEQQRRTPADYRVFVTMQLTRSRDVLAQKLGVDAQFISWPFGVYDQALLEAARACGYVAGVTLGSRIATSEDPIMALPRLLVTDAAVGSRFAAMLSQSSP